MNSIRTKKALRVISVFLLVNFLNSILYPTVSLALTAGPTAPEFSSFEPVDTTDMVNLATGDLTYNIPLIEVPGPEGDIHCPCLIMQGYSQMKNLRGLA